MIMVGETRDSETASISVRAAITSLVFSTLHTNDALSAIVRLRDMGLPAYMVANSLVGIVAQRLVRKVCPLRRGVHPRRDRAGRPGGRPAPRLRRGRAATSAATGYKGRIAIHEVALVDRRIRRMISAGAPMDGAITPYTRESQGMRTLRGQRPTQLVQERGHHGGRIPQGDLLHRRHRRETRETRFCKMSHSGTGRLRSGKPGCSDVHLTVGAPVPCALRRDGASFPPPFPWTAARWRRSSAPWPRARAPRGPAPGGGHGLRLRPAARRQRVNIFWQQGHPAAAIRLLSDHAPTLEELSLPRCWGSWPTAPGG